MRAMAGQFVMEFLQPSDRCFSFFEALETKSDPLPRAFMLHQIHTSETCRYSLLFQVFSVILLGVFFSLVRSTFSKTDPNKWFRGATPGQSRSKRASEHKPHVHIYIDEEREGLR